MRSGRYKNINTARDFSDPAVTNPWIHQPFEGYDALSPSQLMAKWKI